MTAPRQKKSEPTNEPPASMLAIARISAPQGVRGEVRCAILTDFPDRFADTKRVFAGDGKVVYDVQNARLVKGAVVLKLSGVDSREDAEKLRGVLLSVPEDEAVELDDDAFFWHQIIGLRVESTDGQQLGTVAEILQTGSNDVYVVRAEGTEILLPAIRDVIRSVDVDRGVMTVELIEGLL